MCSSDLRAPPLPLRRLRPALGAHVVQTLDGSLQVGCHGRRILPNRCTLGQVFVVTYCQNLAMKASIIKFLIVVAIGFVIIAAIVLFGHSTTAVSASS